MWTNKKIYPQFWTQIKPINKLALISLYRLVNLPDLNTIGTHFKSDLQYAYPTYTTHLWWEVNWNGTFQVTLAWGRKNHIGMQFGCISMTRPYGAFVNSSNCSNEQMQSRIRLFRYLLYNKQHHREQKGRKNGGIPILCVRNPTNTI